MSALPDTPQVVDSTPTSTAVSEQATDAILLAGGFLYAVLCLPAINERGYPPIDPLWHIFPFFWVMPLVLSRVLDTRSKEARWRAVCMYAFATGFFASGAMVPTIVPKQVDFKMVVAMAVTTLLFFGPVHVAIAFLLEKFTQFCGRGSQPGQAGDATGLAVSRRRWAVFSLLLVVTVIAPFGIRRQLLAEQRHRGRTRADDDWINQRAVVYREPLQTEFVDEKVMIDWYYDRPTGLKLRAKMIDHGFADAYNQRIAELIAEKGVPDWSPAKALISKEELAKVFDSDKLPEIRTFPWRLSPGVELVNANTVDWARGDKEIWIRTKSGRSGSADTTGPIFAGRIGRYPKLIFIRHGNQTLDVFHENGEFLGGAAKIPERER